MKKIFDDFFLKKMNSVIESNKLLCEICDTESIGFNFGVRTCMACKAFFRRNAVRLGVHDQSNENPMNFLHMCVFSFCCCRLMNLFVRKMVIVR